MNTVDATFTLCFESPFWVGFYERREGNFLEVAKITFGAEPKSKEVYDFLMKHWCNFSFSPPVQDFTQEVTHKNPKRVQREIKKEITREYIGTKSQQALSLQHQEGKIKRKKKNREQKEAEKERKYQMHQEKQKKKHKGH